MAQNILEKNSVGKAFYAYSALNLIIPLFLMIYSKEIAIIKRPAKKYCPKITDGKNTNLHYPSIVYNKPFD